MRLGQAVPVILMILVFAGTLTSLPVWLRVAVPAVMIGLVLAAVALKRKEARDQRV